MEDGSSASTTPRRVASRLHAGLGRLFGETTQRPAPRPSFAQIEDGPEAKATDTRRRRGFGHVIRSIFAASTPRPVTAAVLTSADEAGEAQEATEESPLQVTESTSMEL